jgi:hypothetical protein
LKARKAFYPTPVPDSFYTGNATPKDYTGGTLGLLEDYYAFEWGEALFITLDPFWNTMTNPNSANDAWHWSLGKPQYDWLRDTLNRSVSHSFVLAPKISPPIEVANVAPGQVGRRWNAIPNKPYQIQWSTDLITWTTIDTLTFTNTNTNATYTDSLPARVNGQRAFYRVMWNP